MSAARNLTVSMVHPALPAYRIPVFEELSRRDGIDLTVIYGETPNVPNVMANVLKTQPYRSWRATIGPWVFGWVADQIRFASPKRTDVLLLEWNLHNVSLLPALERARYNGVRSILWGQGFSKHESVPRSKLRAWMGKLADAVVLYDLETMQCYVDRYRYPKECVFVAQNALDQGPIVAAAHTWSENPGRIARFQQEHGISERPVILHVSRIVPERHLEVLVRAMTLVVQDHPEAIAVVIGDGEPERTRLQGLTRELGIQDSVWFIKGCYEEELLAPWFMSSLAFCTPAHLGLSIFHAFGYGLPVVAGDHLLEQGPEARALAHGHNGLLFEHDNPVELAAALSQMVDTPELAARLGSNGLYDVANRYTVGNMVDGLEAAIRGKTFASDRAS